MHGDVRPRRSGARPRARPGDCAAEPQLPSCRGHPSHNARNWSDEREKTLRGLLALPECTVLGEIGLDYHYDLSPRDTQREVFERQLDLALELDMPVQLHIREAHGEAMELMRAATRPARCRAASCTAFPAVGNWPKFTSHLGTIYRSPAW